MKEETLGPNPYGDQSKGWAILSVTWALVLVALISTIIRIWIRARLTRNLGVDDAVMAIAMVSRIKCPDYVLTQVKTGDDRSRRRSHFRRSLQWSWTTHVLSHRGSTPPLHHS